MQEINDYGEIQLYKIESGKDFWNLIYELINDNSDFLNNTEAIVEEYKNGNLYSLCVEETDSMYRRGSRMDKIFCNNSFYMLPCFCVKNNDTAIIIWVHSRARMRDYGKKLVELLEIKKAYKPLSESIGFWKTLDIELLK